jgi:hypothetical protein
MCFCEAGEAPCCGAYDAPDDTRQPDVTMPIDAGGSADGSEASAMDVAMGDVLSVADRAFADVDEGGHVDATIDGPDAHE